MLIIVLMLCSFAVATAEFVVVGLLPQIAADVSVSIPAAGQLVTTYMVVVTIGGPVATVLTRRLPRRGLLAATMALATGAAVGSAFAGSYGVLLLARLGSALAQALFMAVASQVAIAAVPVERRTAAVARVFAGFALATVIGLPLGALVGQAFGWHATFVLVSLLSGAGLAGVLLFCPRIATTPDGGLGRSVREMVKPSVLTGLLITLLVLTGFVAVFTYVVPVLQSVAGFTPGWVSVALLGYGLGTIAGSVIAGRVRASAIVRVLPTAVGAVAAVLLAQGGLLRYQPSALVSLVLLGGATFVVVPLVQTWLMGQVGPEVAGLAASVNISVAGLAGALGAGLGAGVFAVSWGLVWLSPLAAVPVLAATVAAVGLRRRSTRPSPDAPAPDVPAPDVPAPDSSAPGKQDVTACGLPS